MTATEQITHDSEQQCFRVSSGDAADAVLEYQLSDDSAGRRQVDFTRTFVPEARRGQGIAEALVRKGLSWAKGEGLEIEASCWYVQRFLK